MTVHAGSPQIQKIETAAAEVQALLAQAETAIDAVTAGFADLAGEANSVLETVGAIIGCVEDEHFRTILVNVEALALASRAFVRGRLQATGGMLETVTAETKLLDRLSELTRGQRSIARETQTLSVLTHIEVARLGELGGGFQYLARELDEFSTAVTQSIKELTSHTEERKASVSETRRMLAAGLPRIRQEFSRIEEALGNALAEVGASNDQLRCAPERFRSAVEEIAGQIAGVVSAIQSYDITRQQLEHVQEGLTLIADKMTAAEESDSETSDELPLVSAGLAIQSYQLRSISETVGQWMEQIGICLDGISRISSSEMGSIGPLVLEQERKLSSHLAHIEELEQACHGENEEVQSTFAGLTNLMQLVSEHVEKSRSVRDRLQLLTFNSIVEANHLGSKADAILEISQSIKRISINWSEMTDRSAQAMTEILKLVEGAKEMMLAFSAGGDKEFVEAQAETHRGLENLRTAAACVDHLAAAAEEKTSKLQTEIAAVSGSRDQLRSRFSAVESVFNGLEEVRGQLEDDFPGAGKRANRREAEALFSVSYTTEWEREVLRAALDGAPLPTAQQNLAGNSVELF
jgi:uncharacterized phage infection (PIP) family protein YhgE